MTIVSSGQVQIVGSGQVGHGDIILSGGILELLAGGTVSGATVESGGALVVSSGGTLELLGSNTLTGVTIETWAILEVGRGLGRYGERHHVGRRHGGTAQRFNRQQHHD
jgi:autotransporter passenger strand-loop-strand repeat protein